jgi:cyanophycinase
MRPIQRRVLLILVPLLGTLVAVASIGPAQGTLIVGASTGGGVIERFVMLAGGPEAHYVYIPTASSSVKTASGFIWIPEESSAAGAERRKVVEDLCRQFGVKRITVLHTRDRKVADSEAFVDPLRTADGVWIEGGNAGRLAAAYLDTRTVRELRGVLERGGVIGGTSAGAIIQGSYLVRGRPDKPLLMAKGHERGFGFLQNVVINPHLSSAKRENELTNVLEVHPELLGIGIDDNTALIVRGDRFDIIGEGRVAIYDGKKHGDNWYYWIGPGDSFDLQTRTPRTPRSP